MSNRSFTRNVKYGMYGILYNYTKEVTGSGMEIVNK